MQTTADSGPNNAAVGRILTLRVFRRCHAAAQSVEPQVHGPLHRCKAARASPSHHPPWHTLLLVNRLALVSHERARLEIGAIVAKLVKDLRSYHGLCCHLLHLFLDVCVNEASCLPFFRFLPLVEGKTMSCSRLTALTLPLPCNPALHLLALGPPPPCRSSGLPSECSGQVEMVQLAGGGNCDGHGNTSS